MKMARELTYLNMDAMSLGLDVRDNLLQVRKGLDGYIQRIVKVIEKGKDYNRYLEETKHKAEKAA